MPRVFAWVARQLRRISEALGPKPEAPNAGTPRLMSAEDELWEKALVEYLPTQGTKAREAAVKWGQSAAGLLAVIAITTIFKGRETLDVLASPAREFVLLAVVAALILSFWTLFAAASAATGEHVTGWETGNVFRETQIAAADHAWRWMNASRRAAVGAFLASLLAVVLIWFGTAAESGPPQTLVISADGIHRCGELKVEDDGNLSVGGEDLPDAPPLSFFTVKACP